MKENTPLFIFLGCLFATFIFIIVYYKFIQEPKDKARLLSDKLIPHQYNLKYCIMSVVHSGGHFGGPLIQYATKDNSWSINVDKNTHFYDTVEEAKKGLDDFSDPYLEIRSLYVRELL